MGEMKILRNTTSRSRVVMRRDFVLNICANHVIMADMELKPAMSSDKAWVWFTSAEVANEVKFPISPSPFPPSSS